MASVLRFQDMTPSLTPPPSDRGECEEVAMLNSDSYLAEVFYPSPAPSFSYQRSAFTPQSPDMGQSDSTFDAEEDNQQMFFTNPVESQMYNPTTSISNVAIYSSAMPYQPCEPTSWMSYNSFSNAVPAYPYPSEEQRHVYPAYVSQTPLIPQDVTVRNFSFNDPINRPQDTTDFLGAYSMNSVRQRSPADPSTNSISGTSRSCSPELSQRRGSNSQSRRASLLQHRSSSSSLHSYGIPIKSQDSATVQAWRCAFPNCTSRAVFTRGCDLRKHYNRHSKHLFCRVEGCPQSESACIAAAQQQAIQSGAESVDPSKLAVSGGFSSKKDRARHEAKHNPGIKCEWQGPNGEECGRLFSRMDNMKDHVRRIHNKGHNHPNSQSSGLNKIKGGQ